MLQLRPGICNSRQLRNSGISGQNPVFYNSTASNSSDADYDSVLAFSYNIGSATQEHRRWQPHKRQISVVLCGCESHTNLCLCEMDMKRYWTLVFNNTQKRDQNLLFCSRLTVTAWLQSSLHLRSWVWLESKGLYSTHSLIYYSLRTAPFRTWDKGLYNSMSLSLQATAQLQTLTICLPFPATFGSELFIATQEHGCSHTVAQITDMSVFCLCCMNMKLHVGCSKRLLNYANKTLKFQD